MDDLKSTKTFCTTKTKITHRTLATNGQTFSSFREQLGRTREFYNVDGGQGYRSFFSKKAMEKRKAKNS